MTGDPCYRSVDGLVHTTVTVTNPHMHQAHTYVACSGITVRVDARGPVTCLRCLAGRR